MATIVLGRSEMIKRLVAGSVKTAVTESSKHWLQEIFEKGFIGYNKLSESQLLMEMEMRGLIQSEDHFDDETQDTDDLRLTNLHFN